MSSLFRLQQFSVDHSRVGMRVTSDALLFGAMLPVTPGDRVLDVGTGSGLLLLQAAQRGAGSGVGIDLCAEAVAQARDNCARSPWADRLDIQHRRAQDFVDSEGFDLIISNPPFFMNSTAAQEPKRHLARHTDALTYEDLMAVFARHLKPDGCAVILLPIQSRARCVHAAAQCGLSLRYCWTWRSFAHREPHRVVLLLRAGGSDHVEELSLLIQNVDGSHTEAVRRYLADFLLRYQV